MKTMKRTASLGALMTLLLALAACAGDPTAPGGGNGNNNPGNTDDALEAAKTALEIGYTGTSAGTAAVEGAFQAAVQALFFVNTQLGIDSLTGTYTQSGQSWTFDAVPNDQMIVRVTGAPEVRFTWTRFELLRNLADIDSVDDILDAFDVAGSLVVDGVVDIQFTALNNTRCCGNGSYAWSYQGMVVFEGETWTIDESGQASTFFESSFGSVEYYDDVSMVGDYVSGTQTIHVERRHDYDSISVDNLVADSRTYIASRYVDTAAGIDARYVDATGSGPAFIREITRDAQPTELDNWSANGQIVINGAAVAAFAWEEQVDGNFRLTLRRTDDGADLLE